MSPFTRILIGLLVAFIGFLMVYKTQWFMNAIGRIAFAEKVFGGGGTRLFYKLAGIGTAGFGLILATNLFEVFFGTFILGLFSI